MWNKTLFFIGILALALVLFLHPNLEANAQTTYKLLAPLPGGDAEIPADGGFSIYAAQVFWFLLSAAVILALVMLVIGGVQYVGSLPAHEGIIGMTHYRGKILIAGDRGHLYELKADKGLNGYEYTLISRGLSMDTRAVERDLT